MASGVWLREQREKEEIKELGIGVANGEWRVGSGLVLRGRVLNHKDAMTQMAHKEKSMKICLIREHIFLNTNGEWSLAKRERGKKGIGLVVTGRVLNHKDAMTQKGYKEKSVKICLICGISFLKTQGTQSPLVSLVKTFLYFIFNILFQRSIYVCFLQHYIHLHNTMLKIPNTQF